MWKIVLELTHRKYCHSKARNWNKLLVFAYFSMWFIFVRRSISHDFCVLSSTTYDHATTIAIWLTRDARCDHSHYWRYSGKHRSPTRSFKICSRDQRRGEDVVYVVLTQMTKWRGDANCRAPLNRAVNFRPSDVIPSLMENRQSINCTDFGRTITQWISLLSPRLYNP